MRISVIIVRHYSKTFSDLVDPQGAVVAVAAVPEPSTLVSAEVLLFQRSNVTLVIISVSDQPSIDGKQISRFDERRLVTGGVDTSPTVMSAWCGMWIEK